MLTEWDEFATYDWQRLYDSMQKPAFIFDGVNLINGPVLQAIGFVYQAIGFLNLCTNDSVVVFLYNRFYSFCSINEVCFG